MGEKGTREVVWDTVV